MPVFRNHGLYVILFFFVGCSVIRPVAEVPEEDQLAREAYLAGEYDIALEAYETLIEEKRNQQESIEGEYFNHAGLAAFHLGEASRALDHLERARHTEAANEQTYAALARLYREIDNLSREITHLDNYLTLYPEGELAESFRIRYFETLTESMNWQQAYDLWPLIEEDVVDDISFLSQIYEVNQALGHEEEADRLAQQLLQIDPYHTEALDRLAKRYFHRAETRYNAEMAAYDQNRTQRQYAQLLAAFEELNKDFRAALTYFLRLYEQNPSHEYASYLYNIYSRFDNEERARYFRGKLQE